MDLKIFLPLFLISVSPVLGQKVLQLKDKTYEPQIRTVLCYPDQPLDGNLMLSSADRLDSQNLIIEFDELTEERQNYYVKLIHCNFDWRKSELMDLDFMHDFNEFPVNDYAFSLNTVIPYVHYRFPLPAVKIPGNYVAIVYRDGNLQDLVLSRRFMIYNSQVDLVQDNDISGLGNLRTTNQALNFMVNYGKTEIINPLGSVHVTIRQNQRWDNAQQDVKPSFVREDISQLEYRFFDLDKTFQAGNEFRFVDFRSLNYPGQNTLKLDKGRKPYELYVNTDAPRTSQAYAQYTDLNGGFYIDNTDYRQEPWISANYLAVNFGLNSQQANGEVYLLGAFNGWSRSGENKMQYDQGMYSLRLMLKQGFYNYMYWVDSPEQDGNQIEGNHFQTENVYEVLVYYRPFQPNADLLIGYFVLPVNQR